MLIVISPWTHDKETRRACVPAYMPVCGLFVRAPEDALVVHYSISHYSISRETCHITTPYQPPDPIPSRKQILFASPVPATDLSRALTISLRKPLLALVIMPRLHAVRSHDDIVAGIRRRLPLRRDRDAVPVHIVAETLVRRRGPVVPRGGVRFRLHVSRWYRRHVELVGP